MKFFIDENLPLSIVDLLKSRGFNAEHVRTSGLSGATDKEIAEYAKKQKAILVTKDLEFGSLILYPENSHYGLLILRLPNHFTAKQIILLLKKFFSKIKPHLLINTLTVLEVGKYRMRRINK